VNPARGRATILAAESAVVLCSLLLGRTLGLSLTWCVARYLGADGLGRMRDRLSDYAL